MSLTEALQPAKNICYSFLSMLLANETNKEGMIFTMKSYREDKAKELL